MLAVGLSASFTRETVLENSNPNHGFSSIAAFHRQSLPDNTLAHTKRISVPKVCQSCRLLLIGEVLTFCRPGSSGRYQPRRGSTSSSIHSIGGTLDTASHWHGLNESGQNGRNCTCLILSVTDTIQPYLHFYSRPLYERV